jgi:hypothetical protein
MEIKRKRGGQPGNQNARKHGFYSSNFTTDQLCEFWNNLNLGGVEPELVALRLKLNTALCYAPDNRRILIEASKLLAKWYRSKYHLNTKDNAYLKKYVRGIIQAIKQKSTDFNETNCSRVNINQNMNLAINPLNPAIRK